MSTTPTQQQLARLRAERKRVPKLLPYKLGGSAKRLAERQLSKGIQDLVFQLEATVLKLIPEIPPDQRTDANPVPSLRSVRGILKPLTTGYQRSYRQMAFPFVENAEKEQRAAEKRSLSPLGLDVVGSEPWLKKELQSRAKDFSELIVQVGQDVERRVAEAAFEALEKGRPREWLRRQIRESGDIGVRRAKLIARDQVGKLQGALHEARQKDLGIESYVWRTSRDERVAGNPGGLYPDPEDSSTTHGDHHVREGRRFSWKKDGGRLVEVLEGGKTRTTEYADGHPGEPISCRCFAEPQIVGLEDLQDLGRDAPVASRYKVR